MSDPIWLTIGVGLGGVMGGADDDLCATVPSESGPVDD